MSDEETISVYDARVSDYIGMTQRDEVDPDLVRFMDHLKVGAYVLDLGCGPAASSVTLREYGFMPDPVDASGEMVRHANEVHGINARVATFDDITQEAVYDGIWANFSLLHAPRANMEGHLEQIKTALKPDGIFHIGMKLGESEFRDNIGRFYSYYTQEELNAYLKAAGFEVLDHTLGEGGGLSGKVEPWVTILARA